MTTPAEEALFDVISPEPTLKMVEPYLYSAVQETETANVYDTDFGNIYEWVACNPLYNRLVWGYPITKYASLLKEALTSSSNGTVLDLACGSLAFTADTHIHYADRPVVLSDQSLKMLRMAKARLIRLHGHIPDHIVLLQADALHLPFRPDSFQTIISLNLLHCLKDIKSLFIGLHSILSEDGKMVFTTLVKGNRFADRYLNALAKADKLEARDIGQIGRAFEEMDMPMDYHLAGNLAFITCLGNKKSANNGLNRTVAPMT